jgi:phage FluMu protein Com
VATSIRCPECRSEIAIQPSRAGRFRSKCPKCSALFAVMVPEEEGGSPVVASLEAAPTGRPATPAVPNAAPEKTARDPDETITQEIPWQLAAMISKNQALNDETVEEVRFPLGPIDPPFQPPRSLGGYRVGRRLALIRVGASFEATRKSTGRRMALAVVKPRWAAEATFAARFAREAFAAQHLDHPNLIPPVDVNVARGFEFAADDAPGGESLADPRGRQGFDRTARVSAILHATRALQHAHEQGIYHRDLSLSKIRVDEGGLVRLAEVGVGLTPETPELPSASAIPLAGLPPSLAPESPSVGPVREDIVALGLALHSLIGGSQGDRALTPGLASVVRRMLGEGPEAAYPDLGAVVRALEAELGVGPAFLARDEESTEFENCARSFENAPLANLRPMLSAGFAVVLGLFVVLTLWAGRPLNALGALAFGAIFAASTVVLRDYLGREALLLWNRDLRPRLFGRGPLLDRVRELLGGTWGDALTAWASVLLLLASLVFTGLLGFWIFLSILAVGLAVARYYALDRPIEVARFEPIARATALIRALRLHGVAEDAIRRFACRQGGVRWEEFFEALFGYEALRSARARWGPDAAGKRRPRFAFWRDPIIDAIDARLQARREARDQALFAALEERSLEARGINLLTARRKSRRISEAIVVFARNYRRGEPDSTSVPLMDALNRVALRPDDYLTTAELEEQAGPPLWREVLDATVRVLFGPRTRFLLGGVCLAGCLLWIHQNDLAPSEKIKEAALNATTDQEKAVSGAKEIAEKTLANMKNVADASRETKSLELGGLSPRISRRLDGFGLGVAGLILVCSAGFGGLRMAAFAIPGALIAALGPQLIEAGARPLGPTSLMAMAIGAGLFALGVVFGRSR